MRYFGKTGMKIKRVGFGGIPIQRISQEDTNKVIDELEKCGVNFIDTARGYTVSEEYLGNALKGRREKFYIATKSMSRDYESMKRDIEISLKNLQTDYIDLYQMHNVKPAEYDTLFGEDKAYRALLEAKEQGKIKHIGITSHGLETVEKAVESDKFETIQFPYNIVENQADEVFKRAYEKGVGTIVMKPLAGGAIDDGTLAMKYLLSREYIDVAIPGMDSPQQVIENTDVLQNYELTEEDNKIVLFALINGDRVNLVFSCSKNLNFLDMNSLLKDAIKLIDGNGGGNKFNAQGGGKNNSNLESLINYTLMKLQNELD